MTFDELDEFQGTTPQMVAEWMTRNGWKETKPNWWERGEDGFRFDQQAFDRQWFWLKGLADVYESGNQLAMLRKINPRLRPWPSKQAREEHRGPWLAVCIEDGTACMGMFRPDTDLFKHTGNHVLDKDDEFAQYWPCDAHGNKVRWPTDDSGNML